MIGDYTMPFERYIPKKTEALRNDLELNIANKKLILDYIEDYVEVNQLKEPTHLSKLRRWHRLLKTPSFKNHYLKKILNENMVSAVKLAIRQINEGAQKPIQLYDYRKELKCFFKWLNIELHDDDQYPKCVRWIKNPKRDNEITPDKILTPEDIENLVANAKNIRDKALIYTLFESTCRANEFLQLKIRDVIRDANGIQLRIKQGKKRKGVIQYRQVRLLKSVHFLNMYMENHPKKGDPNSHLWVCFNNNGPNRKYIGKNLKYPALRRLLKNFKKEAGLKKRLNAQLFRISILTDYAKWMPESLVKKIGGHAQDSRAVRQYYKISDNDVDTALLGRHGVQIENKNKDPKEKTCGRCRKINPLSFEFCGTCGFALSKQKMEDVTETEKLVNQTVSRMMEGKMSRGDLQKIVAILTK